MASDRYVLAVTDDGIAIVGGPFEGTTEEQVKQQGQFLYAYLTRLDAEEFPALAYLDIGDPHSGDYDPPEVGPYSGGYLEELLDTHGEGLPE
jgi:hypothetical protein